MNFLEIPQRICGVGAGPGHIRSKSGLGLACPGRHFVLAPSPLPIWEMLRVAVSPLQRK